MGPPLSSVENQVPFLFNPSSSSLNRVIQYFLHIFQLEIVRQVINTRILMDDIAVEQTNKEVVIHFVWRAQLAGKIIISSAHPTYVEIIH